MILRRCYPDTDVLLTAFFETVKIPTVIKPNLNTENPKLYVSLPISDYLFRKGYKNTRTEMKTKKKFSIMTARDQDFKMLSKSIGNLHYLKRQMLCQMSKFYLNLK